MAGYYDPNKDYSLAIRNSTSDSEIKQLQAERQNKIDDMYGGKDPYNNVNTSASYGSSWHPQTATASSSAAYRGVQNAVDTGGSASADQIAASNVKNTDPNALMAQNAKAAPIVGISSAWDKEIIGTQNPADLARIEQLSKLAKEAAASGNPNPAYHQEAEAIRAKYQYSGGAMGDEYIPLKKEVPQIPQVQSTFDPSTMRGYLDQWLSAAQQQQTGKIDFATQQAIAELMRTKSDADATFQEQRNQIAVEEAKAKDNQALYAERRGDRGGIGQAQYDIIMATAAQNRLAVNQAQTKLATDTARQISDLRAQGEFEKADALLSLSQQYLSQLISLEQWAAEYNLSVAQFNESLKQWKAEFDMAVADLTGYYNGAPTFKNQQWQTEVAMTEKANLAEQGWMFLKAGIQPTASQLAAMGMSAGDAQNYLTELKITGKAPTGLTSDGQYASTYQAMYDAGITNARDALNYLTTVGGMKTDTQIELAHDMADTYEEMYNNHEFSPAWQRDLLKNGYDVENMGITNTRVSGNNGEDLFLVTGFGSQKFTIDDIVRALELGQIEIVPNKKNNTITFVEAMTR